VNYDIVETNSRSAKQVKIEALVPYFANGRIKLVRGLSSAVESQILQYPHGRLVDVLDCFSMHMQVYKGDRSLRPQIPVEKLDQMSWGAVMEEVRAKARMREGRGPGQMDTGLTGDNTNSQFSYMDTGLGSEATTLALFR